MRTCTNSGCSNLPVNFIVRLILYVACGLAVIATSYAARASESDGSPDDSDYGGLIIQGDYSDYSGSVIIQGMPTQSTAGLAELDDVPDAGAAGNFVVSNNNTYGAGLAGLVSSGTITYGGGHVLQTAGTLTNPPANWTSNAGTLTMAGSATTVITGSNVLNLAPESTISGATVSVSGSPSWVLSNGESSGYAGEWTINGGKFTLATDGTLILLGTNSGGQSDGTIPEPATALFIFIASMTLLLQRNCSLPRA
jgi:hypothetical protein